MSFMFTFPDDLFLESGQLDNPQMQSVLLEDLPKNMHRFCLYFLSGLLVTLRDLRDTKSGLPTYLSQVSFHRVDDVDGYGADFQQILSFVLRMNDISTVLNACGVVFQSKGRLRQIIVKTSYSGLPVNVCKSMCVRLKKFSAPITALLSGLESSGDDEQAGDDGDDGGQAHYVGDVETLEQEEVFTTSSNIAIQCSVPCLQCDALRKKKKLLLQQVRRLKAKNAINKRKKKPVAAVNGIPIENAPSPTVDQSSLFTRMVHSAGSYLSTINGTLQLSITSGLIVSDLSVHCGVSVEKLPLVLLLVLHLFFGNTIDTATFQSLIKSSSTYEIAMRRASDSVKQEVARSFAPTTSVATNIAANATNVVHTSGMNLCQSVVFAHMIVDDSNKGIDLSVLPYTARLTDGNVAGRALLTVHSITKQSAAWERLYAHIVDQIGEAGVVRFLGGTTDAFGAAVKTMKQLMARIDEIAPQFREHLLHKSETNGGLVLDFSVPIRSLRIVSCRMHNLERCHAPLLSLLMQETGIDNEVYTGQLLYLSHYCTKKLTDYVQTINCIAVGGSASDLRKLPKIARKTLGKVAAQRWISQERTAKELINLVNVPASNSLIEFTASLYGGTTSTEWLAMSPYFVCFHSGELSHYLLVFLLLSNHTTKETSALCWRVLGFLSSPAHRIAIYLTSQLYDKHQQCAAFLDGKSRTHTSTACSTRAIELVPFEREYIYYTHALHTNWQAVFVDGAAFIHNESSRAKILGIVTDETVYYTKYDAIMKQGCTSMYECALKYFYEPNLCPGMSILHLTCAATAPHYAAVLLRYLHSDGLIQDVPPVLSAQMLAAEVYPGVSGTQFQAKLAAYLAEKCTRETIYAAYGLSCECVVSELLTLASHQQGGWEHIVSSFPAIAEVITTSFNAVSITGTLAEQGFSSARNILRKNNAELTHISSLQHFQVVRRLVLDYNNASMRTAENAAKKNKSRTLQATQAKVNYCQSLLAYGVHLSSIYSSIHRSVQDIIGIGKRATSIANNYDDVLEVMDSNKKRQRLTRGDNIREHVLDVDDARMKELRKLPKKSLTPEEKARKLTKEKMINIIRMVGTEIELSCMKKMKVDELVPLVLHIWEKMDPYDAVFEKEC